MSEELKRKLYDYEANPPEKMWSRIAATLDEEIDAKFPRRLYDIEVNPPTNAWNKIAETLEKDNKEEYSTKLYNLEVDPPNVTWEKISIALDEEKALPQIFSKRKTIPFVRYAVAASILAAIAFGGFKLLNQKSTDHSVAANKDIPQKNSSNIQPEAQKNSSAQTIPAFSNHLPKEGNSLAKTNTVSKRRLQQGGYMTQLADVSSAVSNSSSANFQQASLTGSIPANNLSATADGYLMFMNPDGYLIRMSKKLAEALGCVYTNGNSEEYNKCQDQINKWRDKLAQSPATSSPDNFMDLLDIIKSVQDN